MKKINVFELETILGGCWEHVFRLLGVVIYRKTCDSAGNGHYEWFPNEA